MRRFIKLSVLGILTISACDFGLTAEEAERNEKETIQQSLSLYERADRIGEDESGGEGEGGGECSTGLCGHPE